MIVDPGIKVDHGYKPYDDGISKGVFVKVSRSVLLVRMCVYFVFVQCVISVQSF